MGNIQVLDQETINQIAAGEVIDRPASIVKELLENAIDAKATAITIEIKDGGISLIRITDNGCGIGKDDISLAFLRNSTSKIKRIEDLMTVSSLGFRGEALSSIASISQVELITKTPAALTGSRYIIEGGKEVSLEEIGSPEGTTFIIRNIFYNTPARRKFLKTPATEAGYISSIVEHIALSRPDISIRFISNNQNKIHTSGNTNLKDVIYNIYGREIASQLLAVNAENSIMHITGYIGKPVISRGNRNYESYYINGRYIKSSLITKAIEEAYKGFMMQHKYPFTALHFEINPDLLDVNVHPTKMELRFTKAEEIYPFVLEVIRGALSNKELIPDVIMDEQKQPKEKHHDTPLTKTRFPEPFEKNRIDNERIDKDKGIDKDKRDSLFHNKKAEPIVQSTINDNRVQESQIYPKYQNTSKNYAVKENSEIHQQEQLNMFEQELLGKKSRDKHELKGQIFDTYWLVEFDDKLFIIDQHAAHEKVLYEETMKRLDTKTYTSQTVNPPMIMSLTMLEEELLSKYMDTFTQIGYEIEHFGGREYAIRAVPDNLFSINNIDLFIEMLDNLSNERLNANPAMITERIASLSCKAAVKGNSKLSLTEANALIDQLLELENPYHCPHGRPVIISMSRFELEKKFKRIV